MNSFKVLEFLKIIGNLKKEKRTGWVNNKIHLPESIADHMYRMAILSFLIEDKTINKEKCMKISLVHDMAESICGDITPFQGISKEEKHQKEKDAMIKIKDTIGGQIGEELFNLWLEYETASTIEAQIVKDFDKFEMILQAFEYENEQNVDLSNFFNYTKDIFKNLQVKQWVEELLQQRKKKNS